jgi:hypothetical protein
MARQYGHRPNRDFTSSLCMTAPPAGVRRTCCKKRAEVRERQRQNHRTSHHDEAEPIERHT